MGSVFIKVTVGGSLASAALDPDNALATKCRVVRMPGACVLCIENEDCARLPRHVNCRCRPEMSFTNID